MSRENIVFIEYYEKKSEKNPLTFEKFFSPRMDELIVRLRLEQKFMFSSSSKMQVDFLAKHFSSIKWILDLSLALFLSGGCQIKHVVVLASKSLDIQTILVGVYEQFICIILQYFANICKNLRISNNQIDFSSFQQADGLVQWLGQ